MVKEINHGFRPYLQIGIHHENIVTRSMLERDRACDMLPGIFREVDQLDARVFGQDLFDFYQCVIRAAIVDQYDFDILGNIKKRFDRSADKVLDNCAFVIDRRSQ
jgi:hypothetical protein